MMRSGGLSGVTLVLGLGYSFARKVLAFRTVIVSLSARTLQARYAGTAAGLIWSIVHPLAAVIVFWFVFSVGLRVRPAGDIPFVISFLLGYIPWTTFAEVLSANTGAITGNAHLVKKTVFPTEILPVVNILAGMVTHLVLFAVLLLLARYYGISISIWTLQCAYYLLCMAMFSLGLGWLVASANVFIRDIGQMLGTVLNIWFWLTPIAWFASTIPEGWRRWIELNPMYYVVEGYRSSFLNGTPLWAVTRPAAAFWVACIGTMLFGGLLFRRLKPEFADVL